MERTTRLKVSVLSTLRKKRPHAYSGAALRRDSLALMSALGLLRAELDIHLVGTTSMRSLNRQYRAVDKATDVLSFPIHDSKAGFPREGAVLLGDLIICPDVAAAQAVDMEISIKLRMRELLIHGLLHLIGHDHEAGAAKTRKMRSMERALIRMLTDADR